MKEAYRNWLPVLSMLVLGAVLLTSCASGGSADRTGLRPITVEDVSVGVGVGSPIPVEMVAAGTWPDLCAQLAEVDQTVDGFTIRVTLLATPADPDCPPDQVGGVPFRLALPLNVVELPEGEYTIDVNGATTTFIWPQAPST